MKTHPGRLEQNVNLARYSTWRVGGDAQYVYYPTDKHDLAEFITNKAYAPFTFLGLGSNVLIRDGGILGTVIFTQDGLGEIRSIDDKTLYVEAGVPCAKIAKWCARLGLIGGEFLAGIPGSMGGALFMNAGAYGGETWNHVIEVETVDQQGKIHKRTPADFEIAYRHVDSKLKNLDEWFLSATLRFELDDGTKAQQEVKAKIKELLHQRNESQPIGLPSGGSVFRNPPGDYAARLIEAAGLKGYSLGGAQVSPKHANFIINTGESTAADIENLILHVQKTVQDKFGILLEPEVKILGQP